MRSTLTGASKRFSGAFQPCILASTSMARILSDARAFKIPIGRSPISTSCFVDRSKLASISFCSFSIAGFRSSATIALTSFQDVRARWLGHPLHAEVNVTLPSQITLAAAHTIAEEVRHQLLHQLKFLSLVVIHVDPEEKSGERHHRIEKHSHDGLPAHSHA